jgi:hypothetical protein
VNVAKIGVSIVKKFLLDWMEALDLVSLDSKYKFT